MASIYKRGGKKNRTGIYRIKYFDENGKRVDIRGCSDREATQALARKLESDVLLRKNGIIDSKADRYATEGRKPIENQLDDWKQDLYSRNVTEKQVQLSHYRAKRLLSLANITRFADITPSAIQNALAKLKEEGKSAKTLNDYLASVKQFCSWARSDGRIMENPIDHVKGYNTRLDRRHDRRALTNDEIKRLLKATENGNTLQKCPGKERALIYRLALLSGLRANEIKTLKKSSFDLEANHPTVTVEAAFSKHRRKDVQPLPIDLIPLLQDHLQDKKMDDLAFHMPLKLVRALRKDLEAAKIEYKTQHGYIDFHALRHTFITRLINAGVNPKTTQILARHHDASLTLNTYTHVELIDQLKALKALPALDDNQESTKQRMQATGTAGKNEIDESPNQPGLKSVDTYVDSHAAFPVSKDHLTAQSEETKAGCNSDNLRM